MIDIRWGDVLFLLTFFVIPSLILIGCVLLWRSLTPQKGQHGARTEGEGFSAVQESSSLTQELPTTMPPAESERQAETAVLPAPATPAEPDAEQFPAPLPGTEPAASPTAAFSATSVEPSQLAASHPLASRNTTRLEAQAVRVRRRRRVRSSQPTPREHDQHTR